MCVTCGCGTQEHSHDHSHDHAHHTHDAGVAPDRAIAIERDILGRNDAEAASNRRRFARRGIFALNLMSSPGSGKTTLLVETIRRLQGEPRVAVIEGDQQTSNDAERIRASGAPAIQINTGKGCHLDAHLVGHALEDLEPPAGSVVMIENVGNLVCPAAFDLGEARKVVVLSVTEGEDKPLKYPDMFAAADLMILNKCDLLPYLRFDADLCEANARRVNPSIEVMRVSATSGEGLGAWLEWVREGARAAQAARTIPAGGGRGVNARVHPEGFRRERMRVRGTVQGVGFRPFVYRLARELRLDGWVLNDSQGVLAEVQGEPAQVEAFARRLACDAPPLARVEGVEREELRVEGDRGFSIAASRGGAAATPVTPDAATCPECLAEICDPADRRYRYAFANCTHCGPRFTITRRVPYDRPGTTMAAFAMCDACEREYRDPLDRRFHAQPVACPDCGPRLALLRADGTPEDAEDVVGAALDLIRHGKLVALKGLGGFHLACDARNAQAVARLRAVKGREEKPFAVMFANTASIAPFGCVAADVAALLESRERPIALLEKLPGCDGQLRGVAPGVSMLGAMLPYTPLHYLLFLAASGARSGTAWLASPQALALVMTSANPGGEPLVTGNDEAVRRLAGIADAFVVHDRDICARCDDSVVRPTPHGPAFVRRARGFTPRAIRLPRAGPSVLACGAWLKNTVCVTRGDEAFLSPHIGDLDNVASCEALDEAVSHLLDILQVEPAACAHDLHPDFYSTRFAARFARERGIPMVAVQHHHAHIAAVCAEHRIDAPVLGIALDGVGHGTDGTAWGGELLRVAGGKFDRIASLAPVRLAGGDRAAREPWRVGAALLDAMGRGGEIGERFAQGAAHGVAQILARRVNCPETTSAGRWFDGVAALLGVRDINAFEGQAAMQLEALAQSHGPVEPDRSLYRIASGGGLDLLPLAARLAREPDAGLGAALFHATFAAALAEWIAAAAARNRIATVALGGGCFMNAILSRDLRERLEGCGLAVLEARQAPANDGGIALGQAWVAIERIS